MKDQDKFLDTNGNEITVGATVNVFATALNPFPFTGRVDRFRGTNVVVIDQDDEAFCIPPEELELETKAFKVTWEIELDAATPKEAAKLALEIMRDPDSEAFGFDVEELGNAKETFVDLLMAVAKEVEEDFEIK